VGQFPNVALGHFSSVANSISLPTLGRLIADHCERLEEDPAVDHQFNGASTSSRW
jgi:hypothetical protein